MSNNSISRTIHLLCRLSSQDGDLRLVTTGLSARTPLQLSLLHAVVENKVLGSAGRGRYHLAWATGNGETLKVTQAIQMYVSLETREGQALTQWVRRSDELQSLWKACAVRLAEEMKPKQAIKGLTVIEMDNTGKAIDVQPGDNGWETINFEPAKSAASVETASQEA